MTLTLTHWHVYIAISIVLLFLTFKPYEREYGYITFNGLKNLFFGIVFIIYSLVWGGIFWW